MLLFTLSDNINIEDDVIWNQAVQIIEKTVIVMQTVSDTLKKFSYSVSIAFFYIICIKKFTVRHTYMYIYFK